MTTKGETTKSEPAKRAAREVSYTVFEKVVIDLEPDDVYDAWRVIGVDVRARTDTDAIARALEERGAPDEPGAEYAAVSRWRPRRPRIETVTRRRWT